MNLSRCTFVTSLAFQRDAEARITFTSPTNRYCRLSGTVTRSPTLSQMELGHTRMSYYPTVLNGSMCLWELQDITVFKCRLCFKSAIIMSWSLIRIKQFVTNWVWRFIEENKSEKLVLVNIITLKWLLLLYYPNSNSLRSDSVITTFT